MLDYVIMLRQPEKNGNHNLITAGFNWMVSTWDCNSNHPKIASSFRPCGISVPVLTGLSLSQGSRTSAKISAWRAGCGLLTHLLTAEKCAAGRVISPQLRSHLVSSCLFPHVSGSKLLILGMVIPPLMGNPYNRCINPFN